jgi:hypothetical protein
MDRRTGGAVMSSNIERARRAASCLAHYENLAGSVAFEDSIPDLVADIGHFCAENDLTYLHLLARGISHWRLEMTDPESLDPLPEVTIHIKESE